MQNTLVKTLTGDGMYLSGLFSQGKIENPVVLYLHGFQGDFYSHQFVQDIGKGLRDKGASFLSVQTRGTGIITEFVKSDYQGIGIGSQFELLEEAYLDIDAWVSFLIDKGHKNIVLAGHSLGTLKVVRYLLEGTFKTDISKLLLLCPFDKNGQEDLVTNGKWKEYVIQAKEKVDSGKGKESIPSSWEEVDMSYQTFYSWYKDSEVNNVFDFYRTDYDFPTLNAISIPVHIVVGDKDEYFHRVNPNNPQEAMDILLSHLTKGSGKLIAGATHNFRGFEKKVVKEVLKFAL